MDRGAKHWEAEAEKRKELKGQAQGRRKWESGRYRKLRKGEVTWDIFHFRPQISIASIIPFLLNINCEILARRHRLALEKGKFVGS